MTLKQELENIFILFDFEAWLLSEERRKIKTRKAMYKNLVAAILKAFEESLPEASPGSYDFDDVDTFNAGYEECLYDIRSGLKAEGKRDEG